MTESTEVRNAVRDNRCDKIAHPCINFKETNLVSVTKPILKLGAIVIGLLLSACVVGFDYVAPKPVA